MTVSHTESRLKPKWSILSAATVFCLLFSGFGVLGGQSTSAGYVLNGSFTSGFGTLFSNTHQLVGSVGQPFQSGVYASADHLVSFETIPPVAFIMDTDDDGRPNIGDLDDDGDEMPDAYEDAMGFDPLNASDATQDADDDEESNLTEYQNGTDPRNPGSNMRSRRAVISIINVILE